MSKEAALWIAIRRALLIIICAIEETFDLDRTPNRAERRQERQTNTCNSSDDTV